METVTFDRLLLKTAFCCMASDGNIDLREIATIKSICEKSSLFSNFDFQTEINLLIERINKDGKNFIAYYFELLKNTSLSEDEELTILDFAIQTILADEQIEYSEIKFFKNIRYRLKISNDKILEHFTEIQDIEMFLEEDIITDFSLDKITNQYFDVADLAQFDLITMVDNSSQK